MGDHFLLRVCTPRVGAILALLGLMFGSAVLAASRQDVEGSADVPWIGRYAGSIIVWYQARAFDETTFLARVPQSPKGDAGDQMRVEGARTRIVYQAPKDRSSLEVFRNFEQQLLSGGFERTVVCQREECRVNGREIVRLALGQEVANVFGVGAGYTASPRYGLFRRTDGAGERIVAVFVGESPTVDGPRVGIQTFERVAMETDRIVVPTAAQMRQSLEASGRVALYGIYFDTGDATVKPESQPTLDQVVALLRASPSLRLIVTGHTDSRGDYATNLRLSERRAAAVVAALARNGIAAARLTAFGAGMAAPAASNSNDAGRSKNRRVELVAR